MLNCIDAVRNSQALQRVTVPLACLLILAGCATSKQQSSFPDVASSTPNGSGFQNAPGASATPAAPGFGERVGNMFNFKDGPKEVSTRLPNTSTRQKVSEEEKQQTQWSVGRLAEMRGQLDRAEEIYLHLVKATPADPRPHHRLGILAAKRGNFDLALQYFQRAEQGMPNDVDLLNDIGYAYYLVDQLPPAEAALRRARQLNPRNVRACSNLAIVVGSQGRFEEAEKLFREVNSQAEVESNMAYVYVLHGKFELAKAHYNRALTIDKELKPAAEAVVSLNRLERSRDNFLASQQKMGPHNPTAQPQMPHTGTPQQSTPSSPSSPLVEFSDFRPQQTGRLPEVPRVASFNGPPQAGDAATAQTNFPVVQTGSVNPSAGANEYATYAPQQAPVASMPTASPTSMQGTSSPAPVKAVQIYGVPVSQVPNNAIPPNGVPAQVTPTNSIPVNAQPVGGIPMQVAPSQPRPTQTQPSATPNPIDAGLPNWQSAYSSMPSHFPHTQPTWNSQSPMQSATHMPAPPLPVSGTSVHQN